MVVCIYRVSFPEHPAWPVRAGQRSRQPPDTGVHSGGIPQALRGLELRRCGSQSCLVICHDVVMIRYCIDVLLHGEEPGYTLAELPSSMYRISSKLTINNYQQQQEGIYTCVSNYIYVSISLSMYIYARCRASNSLGQAETSTRVYTAGLDKHTNLYIFLLNCFVTE